MRRRRKFLVACCALLAILTLAGGAPAADWPSRLVTVVVPLGAGGNTDMMARLAAQDLSAKFGQTFVVENRPSAGGAIGTRMVATAAPDGYTLLFSPSSMINLTPQVQKLDFVPSEQLVPITNVGTGAQVIAVKGSLPVASLPEFLAYAKARPGTLNFAVAGTQNISHLAPVLLFARAGVDLVMVPARSEPQAVSDLMSGVVDLYFGNASVLLPQAVTGKIRLLAVGTAKRLPSAPALPAVAETFPGFEFSSWNGFLAPVGTPEPILTAVQSEVSALVRTPEVADRLAKLGIVPGGLSRAESEAVFRHDREAFAEAIKVAKIPPPE